MSNDLVNELLNQGFSVVDLKRVGHQRVDIEKEIWLNETSTEDILDILSLDKDSVEYYLSEEPPYFEGKTKPIAFYADSKGDFPKVQDIVASFKVFILPSTIENDE